MNIKETFNSLGRIANESGPGGILAAGEAVSTVMKSVVEEASRGNQIGIAHARNTFDQLRDSIHAEGGRFETVSREGALLSPQLYAAQASTLPQMQRMQAGLRQFGERSEMQQTALLNGAAKLLQRSDLPGPIPRAAEEVTGGDGKLLQQSVLPGPIPRLAENVAGGAAKLLQRSDLPGPIPKPAEEVAGEPIPLPKPARAGLLGLAQTIMDSQALKTTVAERRQEVRPGGPAGPGDKLGPVGLTPIQIPRVDKGENAAGPASPGGPLEDKLRSAQAVGLTEEQTAGMTLLGHDLYQQGRLQQAEKVMTGLTILDGANPYPFAALGAVYEKQGKHGEAVAAYSNALSLYPQDIYALTNRAEAYLHSQKFTEAASDFQEAIRLDPQGNHPAANRARLLVSLTSGALDLAVEQASV